MPELMTPYLSDDPTTDHPARLFRLATASVWRPGASPLTARSGVLHGPPGSMGELTLVGGTLTVNPFVAVIQNTLDASGGAFIQPSDEVVTFADLPAQAASQYVRSVAVVQVEDGVRGILELLDGPASPVSPGPLPDLPENALALGELRTPPTGQARTVTPYSVRTGVRGGILPVLASDEEPGVYVGQYHDHPVYGLRRWTGAQWFRIGGPSIDLGSHEAYGQTVSPAGQETTIAEFTRTFPTAGRARLDLNFSHTQNANAACYFRLYLDGNLAATPIRYHNQASGFGVWRPQSIGAGLTIPTPGPHTVRVSCSNDPLSASPFYTINHQASLTME